MDGQLNYTVVDVDSCNSVLSNHSKNVQNGTQTAVKHARDNLPVYYKPYLPRTWLAYYTYTNSALPLRKLNLLGVAKYFWM